MATLLALLSLGSLERNSKLSGVGGQGLETGRGIGPTGKTGSCVGQTGFAPAPKTGSDQKTENL